MKQEVFKYLKDYTTDPRKIDRLIISAFLTSNRITVRNNEYLQSYLITPRNKIEYKCLIEFLTVIGKEIRNFGTEQLIELFEFVISPEDRIVNGAVYTPKSIRNYIISKSLAAKVETLHLIKVVDLSCGCGGFLFDIAKQLKSKTGNSYHHIFKYQIFGLDIQHYSITRTKLLLTILAVTSGEDKTEFQFNLIENDALTYNWKRRVRNGFDVIVGNPPYVAAKHLDEETKEKLKAWEVCQIGNPDLYIPFFQIGIQNLAVDGILGFITMNSFFKSLNGRLLRAYFHEKSLRFKIIDFGAEQVFLSKNTYTCICLIQNTPQDSVMYVRTESSKLSELRDVSFDLIPYKALNAENGWNLQDAELIAHIESVGTPFGEIYKTRHGIATLRNDVYIFRPVREDNHFYYLKRGEGTYPIEKGICRNIVNSNKLSREVDFDRLIEKIIFPYDDSATSPQLITDIFFQTHYPNAYHYLSECSEELGERDKGNTSKYPAWYAFGRTQSLDKMTYKLFFPKFSDRIPSYVINADEDLTFYNGCAVIAENEEDLIFVQKLMESSVFWYYIEKTSKPYAQEYYSLNGNYINNFGVCDVTAEERRFVISQNDRAPIDEFFEEKYGIEFV